MLIEITHALLSTYIIRENQIAPTTPTFENHIYYQRKIVSCGEFGAFTL